VAAGVLGSLGAAAPAHARCDQGVPTSGHVDLIELPGTGSHVYNSPGDPTSGKGYIGVHGSIGYIEAGGDLGAQNGYIQGGANDGSVNGKVSGSAGGPQACANDTTLP
jgi:hypothetical protein